MSLYRVLHAIETAQGPVDLEALGTELGIEVSALEGMIAFLVRKGRLRDIRLTEMACGREACNDVCASRTACPLKTLRLLVPTRDAEQQG